MMGRYSTSPTRRSPMKCLKTWQAEEGRPRRLYAQVAHDPERHDADEHDVAADQSTRDCLTRNALRIASGAWPDFEGGTI